MVNPACGLAFALLTAAVVPPPRAPVAKPAPPPAPVARPTPPPPAPPGLSWEDADAIVRTMARLERRMRAGRSPSAETIVVTEKQVNSYLNLTLGPRIPPGVSGLVIRMQQDRLAARAMVDLDRVKGAMPKGSGGGILAFLGGTVPVDLAGRVSSANGSGRVEIEEAMVAGMSLPPALVAQLVSLSTRSSTQPQGFDLLAPFALPFQARQIRVEPGRARFEFDPRP